jgi:histidyl-tRNA synthetase
VVINIGDENLDHSILLTQELRTSGINVILEHLGKVGKRMQNADRYNARVVIFVGSEEVQRGLYKVRDMDSGNEDYLSTDQIISRIMKNLL